MLPQNISDFKKKQLGSGFYLFYSLNFEGNKYQVRIKPVLFRMIDVAIYDSSVNILAEKVTVETMRAALIESRVLVGRLTQGKLGSIIQYI